MRNGNFFVAPNKTLSYLFLPYLWGMETFEIEHRWTPDFMEFLPYLWGMETTRIMGRKLTIWKSSYRTYEEWKRYWRRWNDKAKVRVLTVPMRNGNVLTTAVVVEEIVFLPYLWGMETIITKIRRWRCSVLTVPMRNGNTIDLYYITIYR